MAERRRRRSTGCESESEHTEPVLSEYESTADDSRDVEEALTDSDEYVTEEEETAEEEEDGEEGERTKKIDGERQSGDGEEQPKLDIDEDRQNPAYIPKRGAFYEHDMRLDPDEEKKEAEEPEKRGKGKLWKDDSKWLHDKFDSYSQAPKSRQELITLYGYDITQYDQPPEEAPRRGGYQRRGGRDRKPQFQDFLPETSHGRDRHNDSYDDVGPHQSKSDTTQYRGGRGRRGDRRSDGGQPRRSYSDMKQERGPRYRTYSDSEKETNNFRQDNRDNDRDNYRNRDRNNYGNRGQEYEERGNRDYQDRSENRGGFRGRGRGGFNDNRRGDRGGREGSDNRRGRGGFANRGTAERGGFDNRDNIDQQRGGFGNREHFDKQRQTQEVTEYDRQNSGGKDPRHYERQGSGGRVSETAFRKSEDTRPQRNEPDLPRQDGPVSRGYRANDVEEKVYAKPNPKSYYTLSVTDDEKLMGDMDDVEYSPPPKGGPPPQRGGAPLTRGGATPTRGGVQDLNVTVTGDRRSFNKEKTRAPRSQDYVQQSSGEDRRDVGPPHGQPKHQPTLPPRLQQQQQQQERKRQKQQQQESLSERIDTSQRSNKRYSSQRQRAVPEGPGFPEPHISQPQQQVMTSPIQQHYQPNFSPQKPGPQPADIVRPMRPTISVPMPVPQQTSMGSPTMVIPRGPPPQAMIPVPGQVPPPGVRPQRPPPPQGVPRPQGLPPHVFPAGSLPSTVMPAVSVIAAPLMNPGGILYAAPPPAFQVPVPQFPPAATLQSPQPGETVRGGTTYYASTTPVSAATTGTTYYSPELQMSKTNRVQVRRPKVPLPIVNPEDMKKEKSEQDTVEETDVSKQETENRQNDVDTVGAIKQTKVETVENSVPSENYELESRLDSNVSLREDTESESFQNVGDETESATVDYQTETVAEESLYAETTNNEQMQNVNVSERENCLDQSNSGVEQTEDAEDIQGDEDVQIDHTSENNDNKSEDSIEIVDDFPVQTDQVYEGSNQTIIVKSEVVLTPTLTVSTSMPSNTEGLNHSELESEIDVEQVVDSVSTYEQNVDVVDDVTEHVNAIDVNDSKEVADGNVNTEETKEEDIATDATNKTQQGETKQQSDGMEKSSKDADESTESFEDAVEAPDELNC